MFILSPICIYKCIVEIRFKKHTVWLLCNTFYNKYIDDDKAMTKYVNYMKEHNLVLINNLLIKMSIDMYLTKDRQESLEL